MKPTEASMVHNGMMSMPSNLMTMPMFNPWMQPNIMLLPFPSPPAWPMQVAAPPIIPAGYQLVLLCNIPATPVQHRVYSCKHSHQIADFSSNPVSPTQDSPEKIDISYPPVSDWLTGLNNHPFWGQDNQNYKKWIDPFLDNGLLWLDNLQGLDAEYYVEKFTEMNIWTARRLERYTKEDIAKLRKCAQR